MCFFQRTSFPTAIAHIDCNAFFASVEQVYRPELRDKPIAVSGMGGSCVITASYQARKCGIGTGLPVWEARKLCPQLIIIPADFRHYLHFHQKFLQIVATFSPAIEAASIDECYLDLKGLRRLHRCSYEQICLGSRRASKHSWALRYPSGYHPPKPFPKSPATIASPTE